MARLPAAPTARTRSRQPKRATGSGRRAAGLEAGRGSGACSRDGQTRARWRGESTARWPAARGSTVRHRPRPRREAGTSTGPAGASRTRSSACRGRVGLTQGTGDARPGIAPSRGRVRAASAAQLSGRAGRSRLAVGPAGPTRLGATGRAARTRQRTPARERRRSGRRRAPCACTRRPGTTRWTRKWSAARG
eukprot:scaffold568_cov98-Isochrysis_galbana.AAC.4